MPQVFIVNFIIRNSEFKIYVSAIIAVKTTLAEARGESSPFSELF